MPGTRPLNLCIPLHDLCTSSSKGPEVVFLFLFRSRGSETRPTASLDLWISNGYQMTTVWPPDDLWGGFFQRRVPLARCRQEIYRADRTSPQPNDGYLEERSPFAWIKEVKAAIVNHQKLIGKIVVEAAGPSATETRSKDSSLRTQEESVVVAVNILL